jgi:hypothetical protein
MQKIKMMLLSLALFAVVGGALAFKAKFHNPWCSTVAYSDNNGPGGAVQYFCSSTFGIINGTTTTQCLPDAQNLKIVNQNPVLKVCTTLSDGGLTPCNKVCPVKTSVIDNQ